MAIVELLSYLSLTTIQLTAVVFGLVWITVNFYTYTPTLQYVWKRITSKATAPRPLSSVDSSTIPESEWPTVDVLITAYDEASVIEQAIASVTEVTYPDEKLTVTVLTEPDDTETNERVAALSDEYEFVHRIIPEGYPGSPNKPRALNYGFEFVTGEVVGVIDAEDVVGETLVREAALGISEGGADFVHGVLDMVNEGDGWVNLLFRAEYGYWFRLVAPGFISSGFDIPLPGTTCFFDRAVLTDIAAKRIETLGESWDNDQRAWAQTRGLTGIKPWDPLNVTEDFEIGLLLSAYGYTAGYVPVVTREESPLELNEWIRQRTRWQKGKLYTFLRYRGCLPSGFAHKFHFVYQSLLPHMGPVNICAVVIVFILSRLLAYEPLPVVRLMLSIGLAFTLIAVGVNLIGYWLASDAPTRTKIRRSSIVAVGIFPYWILQWGADVRALYQTYVGQFHWEHTTHLGRNIVDSVTDRYDENPFRPTHTLKGLHRQVLLGLILLAGLAVRLPDIGSQSLWNDEIYSIAVRGSQSLPDLLVVPQDPHPPLYYALLRTWMQVFGSSPLAARSFSLVCSLLSVYVGYLLATRLFDDRTGLVLAGLLAVSVFHVHFGRTARMYSLFVLTTVVSWYGLLDVRTGTSLQRAGYGVSTAAVLYTHVFGVFVVAAQWLYLAITTPQSGTRRPEREAMLGTGILSLPLAYLLGQVLYRLVTQTGPAIDWIPAPSVDLLSRMVLLVAGNPEIYPILAETAQTRFIAVGVATMFLIAVGFSVFSYDRESGFTLSPPRPSGQMFALAVVPTLGPLLVSVLYRPVLVPRYTIPATVGIYVLVAKGVTNVPNRAVRAVVLVFVFGGLLTMGGTYHATESFEDWQGAAAAIDAESEPDDAILYQPGWADTSISYYIPVQQPEEYRLNPDTGPISPDQREQLRTVLDRHDTVWYVQYDAPYDAPTSSWLREHARQATVRDFGIVTVYRFETTNATEAPAESVTVDHGHAPGVITARTARST